MEIDGLVRAFNSLPRFEKSASGHSGNHWQFAVQHVALQPPGDLLHIVHIESRVVIVQGPAQILSRSSPSEQAEVVLPMLLRAFNKGPEVSDSISPFAPWSWGTNDPDLAHALMQKLRFAGVHQDLCYVQSGNEEMCSIQQEAWASYYAMLTRQMETLASMKRGPASGQETENAKDSCDQCQKTSTDSMKVCGGCRKTQYCSRSCQKAAWKEHKKECGHSTTAADNNNGPQSSLNALQYYNTIAPNLPQAQELAARIHLALPQPGVPSQGLVHPIRRLVITGKDTPGNIRTLLGTNGQGEIDRIHEEQRMEVLLRASPGSPAYGVAAHQRWDLDCPAWTPREPSQLEQRRLSGVRDMQQRILRHMGSRSMRTISTKDMQAILVSNFGNEWAVAMPLYQEALNYMDQGVPTA